MKSALVSYGFSRQRQPAAEPVEGTIHTKLTVGKPGDKYEKEADSVADKIVSDPEKAQKKNESSLNSSDISLMRQEEDKEQPANTKLQKQEEEEAQPTMQLQEEEEAQAMAQLQEEEKEEPAQTYLQRQEEEEAKPKVQKQEDEKEPPAQAYLQKQEEEEAQPKMQLQEEEKEEPVSAKKLKGNKNSNLKRKRRKVVPSDISKEIKSTRGQGEQLPSGTRHFMESGFGNEFSKVRVHTGSKAAHFCKTLHAQAFTVGNDIFFNTGRFKPESKDGQKLIAHELTHVIQQTGRKPQKRI